MREAQGAYWGVCEIGDASGFRKDGVRPVTLQYKLLGVVWGENLASRGTDREERSDA